jgi:hypothetical protein
VQVTGTSTGFPAGTVLKAWVRFPGQTTYTEGVAPITISQDGSFSWSRKTGKKTYVYLQAGDGTQSNRVIIQAK